MAEVRYCDLVQRYRTERVVTIGSQQGPPLGEGWTRIATLPASRMPSGSGEYAVIVSGKVGDVLIAGDPPAAGIMQVCAGLTGGTRCPHLRMSHTLTEPPGPGEGIPFQFLFLISEGHPDPVLGSSITPIAGENELCLWARTFRNSDPANYYVEFTVSDVSWLWFDLARIPETDWFLHEVATTVTLPTAPPAAFSELGPAVGDVGETWLHFQNLWYEPRTRGAQAPSFAFRYSDLWPNVETPVGSFGRWGQNRRPQAATLFEIPQIQQGVFWSLEHTTDTTQVGYAGWEQPAAAARTAVHRYRHFAVRIDPLPDVHRAYVSGPVQGGYRLDENWRSIYLNLERPRPSPGVLTAPIVLLHELARFENGQAAYGAYLTEDRDQRGLTNEVLHPVADAVRGEAVSSIVMTQRRFHPLSPAMQWRAHLVGSLSSPAGLQQVQDIHIVAFHPVRDPANTGTPPGDRLTPIVLIPGKQSPAASSLAAPPTQPNANPVERGELGRAFIDGATGYRPRWPVGARPTRFLSLTWGPLDEGAAAAVFSFLRANRVWRWDDPGGEAFAVMSTSLPEQAPTTHRSFTLRIDVAILVWTGGA